MTSVLDSCFRPQDDLAVDTVVQSDLLPSDSAAQFHSSRLQRHDSREFAGENVPPDGGEDGRSSERSERR